MSSQFRTRIYKAREAAEILRTTPWMVTALCRSGELRASRLGTSWRITEDAIDEYLKARELPVQATAAAPVPASSPRRRRRRPTS